MSDCSSINWLAVEAIGNCLVALVAGSAIYAAYSQMRAQLRYQSELEMKRVEQHYIDRLLEVTNVVTEAALDFVGAIAFEKANSLTGKLKGPEVFDHGNTLRLALRKFSTEASFRNVLRACRMRRLGNRLDVAFNEFEAYLDSALGKNMSLARALIDDAMNVTPQKYNELVREPAAANLRLGAAAAALLANMFSPTADEAATLGELHFKPAEVELR